MSKLKLKGMYGDKTRKMQRKLSHQLFELTFKTANVYKYMGSAESETPSINDIQSKVFYEVPDREYEDNPININIAMEPMSESAMDFSRFGMINPMGNEQTIRVHLDDLDCLGRWLIVGDVIEVPFFARECDKAFWEVTDVDDKPSYEKFYVTVQITPLGDSRATQDIPFERSTLPMSDSVQDAQEQEQEAQVPYEGVGSETDEQVPYDARRKQQSSFLDSPFTTFDGDQ